MLQKIIKKTKIFIIYYIQIFLVWMFFALMVFSSYYFLSEIETKHLKRHVEDLLEKTQAN